VLSRQEFELPASQLRVWELLATSILQSLPITQSEVVNDTTMRGVITLKLGPIALPQRIVMEVADIEPIRAFATKVTVGEGMMGAVLGVRYEIAVIDDDRTRVICTANIEEAPAWMSLVRPFQAKIANDMFAAVRKELERVL
jgi:carbon monoxide dehydrogenase subunit G